MTRPAPIALLWASVLLIVGMIGAAVSFLVTGNSSAAAQLVTVGGPLVGALVVMARVDSTSTSQNAVLIAQNDTLATINRNTNGVLDKRIRDGVHDVLVLAGLITATAEIPPPALPIAGSDLTVPELLAALALKNPAPPAPLAVETAPPAQPVPGVLAA